jgi:hypothetical protein
MNFKKTIFISILFLSFSHVLTAQDSIQSLIQTVHSTDDTFKPGGKPIVTIFSDFTSVNYNGRSNNAFEITRAYFGYGYNFSSDFSGKVIFDVANLAVAGTASPGVSAFTVYLKNAYAEYNHSIIKADVGMIGESMFDLQESVWGKRYLYKSFQDQYSFGNTTDLGAKVKLQFLPEVALDLAVFNGEGFKKVQADSTVQLAAGLTVQPVKNFFARVYIDYLNYTKIPVSSAIAAQTSFNAFVGYKSDKGSLGAEYNVQSGHASVKYHDWSGISIYGTLPVIEKLSVFARYDDLISKKTGAATQGWNTTTDGQVYIAGVEFIPVKGIQISPNIRYSDLSAKGVKATTTINLNFGINF